MPPQTQPDGWRLNLPPEPSATPPRDNFRFTVVWLSIFLGGLLLFGWLTKDKSLTEAVVAGAVTIASNVGVYLFATRHQ